MRRLTIMLLLGLSGCVNPAQRETAAEARGFERGYRQAVQEQYWIIQNQQRRPAAQSETP